MADQVKIFMQFNRNLKLPKCYEENTCQCFSKPEKEVVYRKDNPLIYILQVQSLIKRHKKNFDTHYKLICLQTESGLNGVHGHILKNVLSEHFATLSLFQDYLLGLDKNCPHSQGLSYIKHLKKIFAVGVFIRKKLVSIISLYRAIEKEKMYSKLKYDLFVYFHACTLLKFKNTVLFFETVSPE